MKKLFIAGFFVLLGVLGFFVFSPNFCIGCSPTGLAVEGGESVMESNPVFGSISAHEFNNKLSEKDVVLIDIRTPQEFSQGHIRGAKNIDFYSSTFRLDIDGLDRDVNYLIYCRSGSRSNHVIDLMKEMGFVSVKELNGGINSWTRNGLPIVK